MPTTKKSTPTKSVTKSKTKTKQNVERISAHEHERAAHSLDGIFRPRSVAVIGASTRARSIGRQTLYNLISAEFQGKVFPVNPKAEVINSIKAYPSVLDIPDPVDLALIIVPRELAPKVAEECGRKGVKGLVVISAGFKEAGGIGVELEKQVLDIARKYNMRMVGPNCFGVVNTEESVRLNATFGKIYPDRGKIAFVSQSGALGEAIMVHAKELNIGFSMIASIGNKADISGNDLLEYWAEDPGTEIILMYIENFGNPRKFIQIARQLSRRKPIVVVKSGRTAPGARAASSHTGALAALDVGVDAFFEQTGVIRVDTVEQLFDVAAALANQPIPPGRRVAVATNAGGPAILAVDAMVSQGLKVPQLGEGIKKKLKSKLPAETNFSNPLDLIAGAGPKEFEAALRALKSDRSFDAIISIFVPPIHRDPLEVSQAIVRGVAGSTKPTLACFMGVRSGSPGVNFLKEHGIPVYSFPEAIGKTLERLAWYHEWQNRKRGFVPHYEVDKKRVEKILGRAQREGAREIVGPEALKILDAYGIATARYEIAESLADAQALARKMGYPVVMKINTPQVLHKTEVSGVQV
ncbi:MAG TPA: CoA-binding protein, partial [candidate division Zixibacteria bacterium]|nr:CoA-binding protein [candidate division Zixibacteria bacterium]